jgi:hypothetical protein
MEKQKETNKKTDKARRIDISLEVRFVPLPPEQLPARCAGLSTLINILKGENPNGSKELILDRNDLNGLDE